MSEKTFAQFREMVLDDPRLQARLRGIADRGEFVTAVVAVANEAGCEIAVEDVEKEINAGRRAWIERWI
jgi:EAL domain-containing protein (putative c-di-GMP-specific phosphodiesterase class I)